MHLAIYIRTRKKVHLRLHFRLHLSCLCITLVGTLINAQKCTKIPSNGGSDAALEGTLHGGVKIALEGRCTLEFTLKIH